MLFISMSIVLFIYWKLYNNQLMIFIAVFVFWEVLWVVCLQT